MRRPGHPLDRAGAHSHAVALGVQGDVLRKGEAEGLVETHPSGRLSDAGRPRNLSEPNERQKGNQSHAGAVWPL